MEEDRRALRFLLFTDNQKFKKYLSKRINRLRFGSEMLHFNSSDKIKAEITEKDIGILEDDFVFKSEKSNILNLIHDFSVAHGRIILFTNFKKKLPSLVYENQSLVHVVSKSMNREEFSFLIETAEFQITNHPRETSHINEKYLKAINSLQGLLRNASFEDDDFSQVLQEFGEVTDSCRVSLFRNMLDFQGKLVMSPKSEWVAKESVFKLNNPLFNLLPYQPNFNRWEEKLSKGNVIIGNVEDFPGKEIPFLRTYQTKKLLAVPLIIKKRFWGFILFSICRERELWSEREVSLIKSLIEPFILFLQLRKKEDARNVNEERLHKIFESSNIGLVLATSEGLIKSYNPAFSEMIGYSVEELKNLNFRAFTHPDDQEEEIGLLKDLLEGKTSSYFIEKRYIKKGGGVIWVKLNVSAYSKGSGHLDSLISIIENVSNEKAAERALQESEDRYKKLSGLSLEGIVIHQNGIANDFNSRFLEMTEFSREDIIGKNIIGLLIDDEQTSSILIKRISANDIQPFEATLITKSGKEIDAELENRQMKYDEGEFSVTAIRDISDRKRREQEIRKLNTAINQSPSSIVITNKQGEIEYVNKSFSEITGYSFEESLGKNPRVLKTGKHSVRYYKRLWETISSGKTWEGIFNNKTKSGALFWERAVISPIFDEKNNITHYLAIKENITEEKKVQEALRISEERHRVISEMTNDFVYSATLHKDSLSLKWTSGSLVKLTGFTINEIGNKENGWYSLVVDDDFQKVLLPGLKKLEQEKIIDLEYRIVAKNGKVKWVQDKIQQTDSNESDKSIELIGAIQDITQRKEAINELAQSKKYLDSIIDNLPIGLHIFDEEGYSARTNETQRRLFDLQESNGGKGSFNILNDPESISSGIVDAFLEVYRNKKTVNHEIELNIENKNNSSGNAPITLNEIIFPIMKDDGNIHSVISISSDITKRVRAEKALKASEMHQKVLLKIIPDLIFVFTQDGYFKDVYTEDADRLQYPLEKFIGKPFSEIFPGDLSDKFYYYLKLAVETGEMQSYNYELEVDNTLLYYEARVRISGENEVITIIRDITESINYELALKESEEKFRELAERSQDALVLISVTNEILYVSPNLASILGITEKDYIESPRKVFSLIHRDDKRWVISELNRYRKGKLENLDLQFRVNVNGDKMKWVWYRESCIYDKNNNPSRYAAVITDISQNKRVEEELKIAKDEAEKANRTKSAFLANVSHEIRTPMNAVLGFSDLLHSQIQDPVLKGYLNSIKSSGETLLNLLNDILDLSKIEAEKMVISPTSMNIFTVFDEIKHIFSLRVLEKGLDYSFKIDEKIPKSLLLDELRLKQILLNLVDNAVKFTEEGNITVSANQLKAKKNKIDLSITVEDTGIGIPLHLQESIFEAFRQQDDQDKKKFQGTGLGLAITKRLVELLTGKIILKSNPEEGSKFEIILRDVEISKHNSGIGNQRIKLNRIKKYVLKDKTILLIDAEVTNRELIKEVVFHKKNKIIEGASIKELSKSITENVDLIIMEARGDETLTHDLSEITKNKFLKDTPRIGITSNNEIEINKAKQFADVLTKPIQLSRLVQIVSSIFSEDENDIKSIKLDVTDKEVIKNVIDIMEGELYLRWKDTLKTSSFVVIEEFAQSLKNVGHNHNMKSLQSFSDVLVMHAKNFDIDNMNKVLKSYPMLIADLKKTIKPT